LMTVVVGHAALLTAAPTGPEASESLAEIGRAANTAAKLAEQLLAYSRGAMVHPRPVNLNEIVRRAVAAEGEMGARDGFSVELDLDPDLAPTQADVSQMDQLVGSL